MQRVVSKCLVFALEVIGLSKGRSKKKSNIIVPKPEMTGDKKYRCPIDQEVYDNKKDYESHCHEEHDVL